MSVYVCLSVCVYLCLSANISPEPQTESSIFLVHGVGPSGPAIGYVLPALRMTSYWHIIDHVEAC